tara:strand:- start:50803 stop:52680 length:1878 start_codon:yes stop_codon:yes gene_type:complete
MSRNVAISVGAKDNASSVMSRVRTNVTGLNSSLKSLSNTAASSFRSIGTSAIAMGGSVTSGFTVATKLFASTGDALDKMSKRVGVPVESLSELSFAAEQSGASLDDLERGLFGLSRSMFDLRNGSKTAADSFREIGINAADLEGLSVESAMNKVADGIASITDESNRGAVAQRIFGRAGRQLLPLFGETVGGMQKLRNEAKELGRQMSTQDASAAAELTDSLNRLKSVTTGVAVRIGASVGPAVTDLTNRIVDSGKWVSSFVDDNRELVAAVAKVGAGVTVAGGAFLGLTGVIGVTGFALGGLATTATAVATGVAAVFSPVGLVIGGVGLAVAGVGGAFLLAAQQTGLLSDVMQHARQILGEVWQTATTTFNGISDALKAGDWGLSAQIGWAGVKVAFWAGLEGISLAVAQMMPKMWLSVQQFFTRFVIVAADAAAAVSRAVTDPMRAVDHVASFLSTGLQFGGDDSGIAGFVMRQSDAARNELDSLVRFAQSEADEIKSGLTNAIGTDTMIDTSGLKVDTSFLDTIETQFANLMKDIKFTPTIDFSNQQPAANQQRQRNINKEVQATQSRLLTRGGNTASGIDRVTKVGEKANQILERIDKNQEQTIDLLRARPNDTLQFEVIA